LFTDQQETASNIIKTEKQGVFTVHHRQFVKSEGKMHCVPFSLEAFF
jgi:hypothetical protein